jgi:hypothetical protein
MEPSRTNARAHCSVLRLASREFFSCSCTGRSLGIFGEPRVNVLGLNPALNERYPKSSASLRLQGSVSLNRFRADHQVEQLHGNLVLAGLTRIVAQFCQLLRDMFMGGIHCRKACRVITGERLDRRVVGRRRTGSDRYSVTEIFIPDRYTVLRDPKIAPRQPGRLYGLSSRSLCACGVAAVALGIARGMVSDFTELATQKTPRGARQRLCENQVIR